MQIRTLSGNLGQHPKLGSGPGPLLEALLAQLLCDPGAARTPAKVAHAIETQTCLIRLRQVKFRLQSARSP